MEKRDDDRHVVISGGSRGLGAATTAALLAAGYRVSGFSRRSSDITDRLAAQHAGRYFFARADSRSSDEVRDFLQDARNALGPVYGVINNAAVAQEGILATLPEIEIAKMIEVNLTAGIRLTRLCIRDMLKYRAGRVINISSIVGVRGYNGLAVYSASKAGMDGFTRSLGRELGRRNITVNSIAPGYMKTELSSGLDDDQLEQIARRTPQGRLARLEDVTPLVEFLLSDGARFISGQTIHVDGGLSN